MLCPCVINAKILLQKLWLERLSWDDQLPLSLQKAYTRIRNQLVILNNLEIPRHVRCQNAVCIEIHGFCDASESAYGACVYVKSVDTNGKSLIRLLCAKSKVAPLKPVMLPRFELCGAVVLSGLVKKVLDSINIKFDACFLWADSSVVLSWIKMQANTLKTFVSNRVAEIQENTSFAHWRHVRSKDNPADLLSRGTEAEKIIGHNLWWQGPSWLLEACENWPNPPITGTNLTEQRKRTVLAHIACVQSYFSDIFIRFSNLLRLKRSIAYVLRFVRMCRTKTKIVGFLSAQEIENACHLILKHFQAETFAREIKQLSSDKLSDKSSKISNLNPFLDEQKILRVGGRIQNSEFSYNKRHLVVLSSDHHVTKLIFQHFHIELMHAGPQLLLA